MKVCKHLCKFAGEHACSLVHTTRKFIRAPKDCTNCDCEYYNKGKRIPYFKKQRVCTDFLYKADFYCHMWATEHWQRLMTDKRNASSP